MTFEEWKTNCINTFPGSPENIKKLEKFLTLFKIREKLIKTDYAIIRDYRVLYKVYECMDNARVKYIVRFNYLDDVIEFEMGNTDPLNITMAIDNELFKYVQAQLAKNNS